MTVGCCCAHVPSCAPILLFGGAHVPFPPSINALAPVKRTKSAVGHQLKKAKGRILFRLRVALACRLITSPPVNMALNPTSHLTRDLRVALPLKPCLLLGHHSPMQAASERPFPPPTPASHRPAAWTPCHPNPAAAATPPRVMLHHHMLPPQPRPHCVSLCWMRMCHWCLLLQGSSSAALWGLFTTIDISSLAGRSTMDMVSTIHAVPAL